MYEAVFSQEAEGRLFARVFYAVERGKNIWNSNVCYLPFGTRKW